MKQYLKVGIAIVTGTALGAAAVQTLHAQATPLGYSIVEVTINDQDGYNKEYLPLVSKASGDAGGKYLVRGGTTVALTGAPPAPRVVVVQYPSLATVKALYASQAHKDAMAVGAKYATLRFFAVEGVSP